MNTRRADNIPNSRFTCIAYTFKVHVRYCRFACILHFYKIARFCLTSKALFSRLVKMNTDKTIEPKAELTRAQRASDVVTEFCGSWVFIIAFSVITLGWMAFNTFKIFTAFDPYPFLLMNLFLTVISTFQSPLIMMSQNRQMERDRDAVQGLHSKLDTLMEEIERGKY